MRMEIENGQQVAGRQLQSAIIGNQPMAFSFYYVLYRTRLVRSQGPPEGRGDLLMGREVASIGKLAKVGESER
jgi:hypothetical protein